MKNRCLVTRVTLLEFGCDRARNYDIAKLFELRYIGIEPRPEVVQELKAMQGQPGVYNDATFVIGSTLSASDFIDLHGSPNGNLVLMPFNLIGNIGLPELFFEKCAGESADIVVSSWQRSKRAATARGAYYGKCGFRNLSIDMHNDPHEFLAHGVNFSAHSKDRLVQAAANGGFRVADTFETDLIHLTLLEPGVLR